MKSKDCDEDKVSEWDEQPENVGQLDAGRIEEISRSQENQKNDNRDENEVSDWDKESDNAQFDAGAGLELIEDNRQSEDDQFDEICE